MTLMEIAAEITGGQPMGKYTGGHVRPSHDEIARLAYQFYERRGRQEGHAVDDWLSAERQLVHHYQ